MEEKVQMNVYEYMWKVMVNSIAEFVHNEENKDKEEDLVFATRMLGEMANLEIQVGLAKPKEKE